MSQHMSRYLGGEVVLGNDGSQNAPGIPEGTTTVWIFARGGPVYATPNGSADPLTSPVYVPEDTCRILPWFDNIDSLGIYADTSTYAHLMYVKDRKE